MSTELGGPPVVLDPPAPPPLLLAAPQQATAVVVPTGPSPGRGVASAVVDDNGHLQLTYTDGTTADAGFVGGASGGGGNVAFAHTVSAPASLVQLLHDLPFAPAGVLCVDTQGQIVEPAAKTDPAPGVTELTFGFGFTGQIQLS